MKPFLKYALIASVATMIWSLILFLTDVWRTDYGAYLNYVSYILILIFMVIAINEEKQNYGGYISYGQAFKIGFLMMVVLSVIVCVYTYMYFTQINPEIIQFSRDKAIADMEEKGMTQEQIDQAMSIAGRFMSPGVMTFFALFGNVFFGCIFALIIAAILKKDKPLFEDNI